MPVFIGNVATKIKKGSGAEIRAPPGFENTDIFAQEGNGFKIAGDPGRKPFVIKCFDFEHRQITGNNHLFFGIKTAVDDLIELFLAVF
jgi:hypothetical protein